MVSESMLANVIAFEEASVPLKELKQVVGRDGGTIMGRGVVFQTPIQEHLSEADARQLIEQRFQRYVVWGKLHLPWRSTLLSGGKG